VTAPKRAKVPVGVVPHATPSEIDGVARGDEPTADHHVPARIPTTRPPPPVVIGDRVHYAPPQGGGPWHGVVIAHTAGAHTIEVVKPNGNHHVIVAALGAEPGEFLLVT
jgi:hypothetical protein